MADLRDALEEIGLIEVSTHLASGNVIFESSKKPAALEKLIASALETRFGFEVGTFVRSESEVRGVVGHKAFTDRQLAKSAALNVAFLASKLDGAQMEALDTLTTDIDTFHVHGRHLWWLCAVRQSDSKFSNALLERKLKITATFRSHSSLSKLAAKL